MQNVIYGWNAYIFLFLIFCYNAVVNRNKHMSFHITLFIGDKNYIECTVEFKIKEDTSVNNNKIQ